MPRLTQKNYLSRRVSLQNALVEAQSTREEAAYRDAIGEGVGQAISKAQTTISELEGRIAGLDIAWERTQREVKAEAIAAEAVTAAQGHDEITNLLARRLSIASEMQEAARQLSEHYVAYQEAGRAVTLIALNHRGRFTQDRLAHMRGLIDGSFNDIRRPLSRHLQTHGLDLSDFSGRGFATDRPIERDLGAFAEWQNSRVADHAVLLIENKDS